MTDSLDLAWMAGIVDGEGCLTIARQIRSDRPSPAFRPSVTIANTDKRILEPFVMRWGGGLYGNREKRKNWAEAFTWHCADRHVREFLTAIIPHLRAKKTQALRIIDFIDNKKKFKRHSLGQGKGSAPLGNDEIEFREKLWKEVRLLNSKGPTARRAFAEGGATCSQTKAA